MRSAFPLIQLLVVPPRRARNTSSRGFTLIELLVVVAIIAILAIVVILTLNPAQLLAQARDSNRLSDLASLQSAMSLYRTDIPSGSLGLASTTYLSLPDPTATSSAGTQCQGLGFPSGSVPYDCSASSTYRRVDGTGWIPVSLSQLSYGTPLGNWPQDPINTSSSGLFYTYQTNGSQYEVTSLLESQKYKAQLAASPMLPSYPEVAAEGTNLTLSALWNPQGLVGYWPMDEGTGTVAQDLSGNGNNGTLVNGPAWGPGKVGSGALIFNNSNTYIQLATFAPLAINSKTISLWANPTGVQSYNMILSDGNGNYYVTFSGTGDMFASYINGSSVQISNVIASGVVSAGTWGYYTFVYNVSGANVTIQAYKNGQLVGTQSRVDGYAAISGSTFYIGALQPAANFFNGSLDDVRVYNRALSAAEVQALYNAEK